MSSVYETPTKNFYVHIGAPDPIIVRYRTGGSGGTLLSLDSSLQFSFMGQNGLVNLGVGTGITLSDDEGVTNARATVQLTIAQSRAIPVGALTNYELQRIAGGREEVILMGTLIGFGGGNADA